MKGDDAISQAPKSRFSDVRHVASTGSTNTDVMELARNGAGEGVVLVADEQFAGRGRAGRTWTAPPGASLLCTILLRPPAEVAPLVTFALAIAAADAVESLIGVRPGLKWPNDLVVERDGATRKLAGILAEAEWPPGAGAAAGYRPPVAHERATVAAGIGLNVAWPDELPDELADIAVAMNHLLDVPAEAMRVTRDDVLAALLERLEHWYELLITDRVDEVLDAWRARTSTLGRRVRVDRGADDLFGTAVDVSPEGHLVVRTDDGEDVTVAVGDVTHVRAV